jgi:hypothetical protein
LPSSSFCSSEIYQRLSIELGILRYLFDWRTPKPAPGEQLFRYDRGSAVIAWTLVGASIVEAGALHVVLILVFKGGFTWIVIALGEVSVLYLVALANSLRVLPIVVSPAGVRLRAGVAMDIWIPLAAIRSITQQPPIRRPAQEGVFRGCVLAYPTLVVDVAPPLLVKPPFRKPHPASRIGLCPDDAPALLAAVGALRDAATARERRLGETDELSPRPVK